MTPRVTPTLLQARAYIHSLNENKILVLDCARYLLLGIDSDVTRRLFLHAGKVPWLQWKYRNN